MLDEGAYASVSDIGDAENISKSYVSRILRLALLAPDIVEAIVAGRAGSGADAGAVWSGRCRRAGRTSANSAVRRRRRPCRDEGVGGPADAEAAVLQSGPPRLVIRQGWRTGAIYRF